MQDHEAADAGDAPPARPTRRICHGGRRRRAPPPSLTDASTIWELLERQHGAGIAEVRLVRLSWLMGPALQRHTSSRWERLPPRAVLGAATTGVHRRAGAQGLADVRALRYSAVLAPAATADAPHRHALLPILAVTHDWKRSPPKPTTPTAYRRRLLCSARSSVPRAQAAESRFGAPPHPPRPSTTRRSRLRWVCTCRGALSCKRTRAAAAPSTSAARLAARWRRRRCGTCMR